MHPEPCPEDECDGCCCKTPRSLGGRPESLGCGSCIVSEAEAWVADAKRAVLPACGAKAVTEERAGKVLSSSTENFCQQPRHRARLGQKT